MAQNAKRKPIFLMFDIEPDGYMIDPTKKLPWRGFENGFTLLQGFRGSWQSATGQLPAFSWFIRLDPQVEAVYGEADWPLQTYARQLATAIAAGDDLGIHPHPFRPRENSWVINFDDQPWINHCIELCYQTYRRHFGYPCKVHQFGDRWLSNETVALLEQLGIQLDVTLEPLRSTDVAFHPEGPHSGAYPDFRKAPRTLYRPSRTDFLSPGQGVDQRNILMLPLSTAVLRLKTLPFLNQVKRLISKGLEPLHEIRTLGIENHPTIFKRFFNEAWQDPAAPYITSMIRSSDFIHPKRGDFIHANLKFLLNHPQADCFELTTPLAWLQNRASVPASIHV